MGWFHILLTITLSFSLIGTPNTAVNGRRAVQQPTLPSSFYGSVLINGENVPTGTTVQAVIMGQIVATCQTLVYEGASVYTIDIPGDDPGTNRIDGGKTGDTITFLVNGLEANETAIWRSGTNIEHNLTVLRTATPVPTPTRKTPTLTPMNPTPTLSIPDVIRPTPTSTGTRSSSSEITTATAFTAAMDANPATGTRNTTEYLPGIHEPLSVNSEEVSMRLFTQPWQWILAAGFLLSTLLGVYWMLFRNRNHG